MSPEYKIRKEIPPTEESCLSFIRSLMSRDLNKEETKGIKDLISRHGASEIQGQAADLMREAEQMAEESKTAWVDKYLKEFSGVFPTIHTWMARRIERQNREDNLIVKSATRITNQILNSPTGQSTENLISVVRSLGDIQKN